MIGDKEQGSNASYAFGNQNQGMTDIFISHNWDKELLLRTNYLMIQRGDIIYARSTDPRLKFNNLKIQITAPYSPQVGEGGLHAYTNDLVLPPEFYSDPVRTVYLSPKPYSDVEDKTVTYVLPNGQLYVTSPLSPPSWTGTNPVPVVNTPAVTEVDPNPATKPALETNPAVTAKTTVIKTMAPVLKSSSIAVNDVAREETEPSHLIRYAVIGIGILLVLKLFKVI